MDFVSGVTWGGKVPVDKEGIGDIEGQWLERAQVVYPSTGGREFPIGVNKREQNYEFRKNPKLGKDI